MYRGFPSASDMVKIPESRPTGLLGKTSCCPSSSLAKCKTFVAMPLSIARMWKLHREKRRTCPFLPDCPVGCLPVLYITLSFLLKGVNISNTA